MLFSETEGYDVWDLHGDGAWYSRLPSGQVRRWEENEEWCDCCPKDSDEIIELTPELDEKLSQFSGLPLRDLGVIYNGASEPITWADVRAADDVFFFNGRYLMAGELDLIPQLGAYEWDGEVNLDGDVINVAMPQCPPDGLLTEIGRPAISWSPEYRSAECFKEGGIWAGRYVQLSRGNWWKIY